MFLRVSEKFCDFQPNDVFRVFRPKYSDPSETAEHMDDSGSTDGALRT